jgi:hypothetical protein
MPSITVSDGVALVNGDVAYFEGADYAVGPDRTAVISVNGLEIATINVPRSPESRLIERFEPLFDLAQEAECVQHAVQAALRVGEYRYARVLRPPRTRYELLMLDEDWFA